MTDSVNNTDSSTAAMHSCSRNQCWAQSGLHEKLMDAARAEDAQRATQVSEN